MPANVSAGFQAVLRAAIRALNAAGGGDVEENLGMEVPDRGVRARARQRQVVAVDFQNRDGVFGGGHEADLRLW